MRHQSINRCWLSHVMEPDQYHTVSIKCGNCSLESLECSAVVNHCRPSLCQMQHPVQNNKLQLQ